MTGLKETVRRFGLLLWDLFLAVIIWIAGVAIMDLAFPGVENADGTASNWWTIFPALALAIGFLIWRRRRRRNRANDPAAESDSGPESQPIEELVTRQGEQADPQATAAVEAPIDRQAERSPQSPAPPPDPQTIASVEAPIDRWAERSAQPAAPTPDPQTTAAVEAPVDRWAERSAPSEAPPPDPQATAAVEGPIDRWAERSVQPPAPPPDPPERTRPRQGWIPPGESVTVHGRTLTDGMVYVGTHLPGIAEYIPVDPALIDPTLPVDDDDPDVDGLFMGYWPFYSKIGPDSRAAYLDWLAAGRPAGASIGYVFLFFYGLERRLLFDLERSDLQGDEASALIKEVERLLSLYPGNRSFSGYASQFLSVVNCLRSDLDPSSMEPPTERNSWELPLELKLGLGSLIAHGKPIPARWALSWLRQHPEVSLRTPAERCPQEFDELFQLRYEQRFGAGMILPRNETSLSHSYQPASASFRSQVTVRADAIPDVSRLKRPVRELQDIAESAMTQLDPFSRWVGKHNDRDSLNAIARLPQELASRRETPELAKLTSTIQSALGARNVATLAVRDLTEGWSSTRPGAFTAQEASAFANLLESQGFGVAPDIRYSNVNLTKHSLAAVFRLESVVVEPSEQYQAATVLLQLGAAVSAADGTISDDEERALASHLEDALHLSPADRRRLRAYLQWLLAEPPTLNRMRSQIDTLGDSERRQLAHFVITIAGADGHVSSDEVKVLTRIYKLLGLDEQQLHTDIHQLASQPPTGPVTVLQPGEPTGHRIQPPPAAAPTEVIDLDRTKIAEIMQDTQRVAELLTEIFEGPTPPEPREEEVEDEQVVVDAAVAEIAGGLLDPAHAELVQFLSRRQTWPRSEFDEVSGRLGLMPAGAIETINDAAFQRCDEPLIEGNDPLDLNEYALKEMLNA